MTQSIHQAVRPSYTSGVAALLLSVSMSVTGAPDASAQQSGSAVSVVVTYDNGQGWTDEDRRIFYTTTQGSHMMPFAWFKALRRLDRDEPFGADQLQRYGYLRNDAPWNTRALPIGFVVEGSDDKGQLGMTCAACHTSQIEYRKAGQTYAMRIDGAPAMADFQQFLTDLTAAARATAQQPERFEAFARAVLGTGYSPGSALGLKDRFEAWVNQFATFMEESLPASPWGPGRLDAFGMIFNRVTAHDLGVKQNFRKADAPVSYPFLWNASRQDRTQWTAAVPNGLFIEALARNAGEVFGVFGEFTPQPDDFSLDLFSMLSRADPRPNLRYFNNSVNFRNLQLLEEKIDALKPPAWPSGAGEAFQIKADLAREGQRLFLETCADKCHGDPRTTVQGFVPTPAQVVGTDPKMAINAGRIVQTGRFNGTRRPPPSIGVYDDKAPAHEILASAVIGSILEEAAKGLQDLLPPSELRQNNGVWRAVHKDADRVRPNERSGFDLTTLTSVWEVVKYRLQNLFESPHPGEAAYEARALHGIWATAPYLHNGSVPNLWELLQPPHKRAPSFSVGDRTFDPRNVGFATDGSPYKTGTFVVDPANANGNGNRGHDYGTNLTDDQRWAIIEYLKTL